MAQVPDGVDRDALTVATRRVLLDALDALRAQHGVIVVGAQAVYLRSPEVRLPVASFTSDADLGLNPRDLVASPLLEEAMSDAGFTRVDPDQPGSWIQTVRVGEKDVPIPVDLLVPEGLADGGRRSTSIPPHDRMAARRVPGLECVVLDHDQLLVTSLDPAGADTRRVTARVAGHAALMVAKAYKIHQRANEPGQRRLIDKDAGDVARLMMTDLGPQDVATRFAALLADAAIGAVARIGLDHLVDLFGAAGTLGTSMAAAALDDERVRVIAPAYLRSLRAALEA